jgi:hypothetical protein
MGKEEAVAAGHFGLKILGRVDALQHVFDVSGF